MENPAEVSVVATSGRSPSLDELIDLDGRWTGPARDQLIAAAAATDAWLADHPDDAERFFDDPAGFIAKLSEAGLLTKDINELLAVVQSRPAAKRRMPGQVVRFAGTYEQRTKGER